MELPYKKVYNELIAAGWSLQQNERSGGIFVWLKILARKLKFEFEEYECSTDMFEAASFEEWSHEWWTEKAHIYF